LLFAIRMSLRTNLRSNGIGESVQNEVHTKFSVLQILLFLVKSESWMAKRDERIAIMRHVAIIGSGPAGCYLADQLLRLMPDASVDVLDRLPVPFGLIRYGVAPDHQSTKLVARVLDRVLSRERVNFFGNVEVGGNVRLDEVGDLYDAVVLAIGATRDRRLGIPREDLPGVVGSGKFTGWYNTHPDAATPFLRDVRSVVIIGNGNVAIDVARMLAKDDSELVGSDLAADVTSRLMTQPIENIHLVGRRSTADAKFTEHELAELGTLKRARPIVADPASLKGDGAVVEILGLFAFERGPEKPVSISFHFNLPPAAFVGNRRLSGVQFRAPDGSMRQLNAQLAVTCIGYETQPCCGAVPSNGAFANEEGKVGEGLYVAGWARRGPSGTIPTNRAEAQQVAQKMACEVTGSNRPGGDGLRRLLRERSVRWVDYAGWRRIDAAELAIGSKDRCRQKFARLDEMLEAAEMVQFRSV